MPIELLTMLASGAMGFLSKMWANNSKDKADQHRMMMESLVQKEKGVKSARKFDTPDSNIMRKFIVIALFSMLGFLLVGGMFGVTNILIESTTNSIFGFIFGSTIDVIQVEGLVAYPWMHHVVLSIIAFYFGTGSAKR